MWELILGSCEKVVFNDDFQSGLKRCYYLDPRQEHGVGAVSWVFYKNGTTLLYWKGWGLHTINAQVAMLTDEGKWHVLPKGKLNAPMGYFAAMRTFFEKAKNAVDGKLTLNKLTVYLHGRNGRPLMDKKLTIWLNKNSASDPNPTE